MEGVGLVEIFMALFGTALGGIVWNSRYEKQQRDAARGKLEDKVSMLENEQTGMKAQLDILNSHNSELLSRLDTKMDKVFDEIAGIKETLASVPKRREDQ